MKRPWRRLTAEQEHDLWRRRGCGESNREIQRATGIHRDTARSLFEVHGGFVPSPRARSSSATRSAETAAALQRMLGGLVTLYDVDGGGVYLVEEDALSLRREAVTETRGLHLPELVALGDGTLGRAALERRTQFGQEGVGSSRSTLIAVPVMGGGRLLWVIALGARVSRPIGRNELLLLQAFANRVGDVLASGGDVKGPLAAAMEGFRASWSAAGRVR